jgi:hypothetical protein
MLIISLRVEASLFVLGPEIEDRDKVEAGFQFRKEFLLLQLKCDLLVGSQDRAYSLRNARNREDAAQRSQRLVKMYNFQSHPV